MKKISKIAGIAAPLVRADIDTDAMVPQRWLVTTTRKGLGKGLFGNWRYLDECGTPNGDFVLNQPRYDNTKIIVAGPNYGCGSSREHAVWAHLEYGIEAVVAASFGPIFRDNALRNGLLTVKMSKSEVDDLLDQLVHYDPPTMEIDLASLSITGPGKDSYGFSLDEVTRQALMSGQDEISAILHYRDEIDAFQAHDRQKNQFYWEPRT